MPRPPTYVSILLGLVAAGASTYAWLLRGELTQARARPPVAQVQVTPPVADAAEAATAPVEEAEEVLLPRRSTPGPDAAIGESSAEGTSGLVERRGGPGRNSPQMRQLIALQQRSLLDSRYAALFRKLNLSPADLEKLKALIIERQSASMDVYSAAREEGLTGRENRDQIRELIKGLEAESDAAIRGLLGETNYQQLRQYEMTAPQRNVVAQVEQRLSYSATPFYGNQAEQLVALMAAAAPPSNRNGGAGTALLPFAMDAIMPGGRVQIPNSVIDQSTGFLSAPQVQALRDYQREQQAQLQLMREMQPGRRNRPGSGPGSAGP